MTTATVEVNQTALGFARDVAQIPFVAGAFLLRLEAFVKKEVLR